MSTLADGAAIFYRATAAQLIPAELSIPRGIFLSFEPDLHLPDDEVRLLATSLARRLLTDQIEVDYLEIVEEEVLCPLPRCSVVDLRSLAEDLARKWISEAISFAKFPIVIICNRVNCNQDNFDKIYFCRDAVIYDVVAKALSIFETEYGANLSVLSTAEFMSGGFRSVADHNNLFYSDSERTDFCESRVLEICSLISKDWIYRGNKLSREHVANWVEQFRAHGFLREALCIIRYLHNDGFLTRNQIIDFLEGVYGCVSGEFGELTPVSVQEAIKSEPFLLGDLSFLPEKPQPIADMLSREDAPKHLVCFDDVIGSGDTFKKYLFEGRGGVRPDDFREWLEQPGSEISIIVAVAGADGKKSLEQHPSAQGKLHVFAHRILQKGGYTFHPNSSLFANDVDYDAFIEFCKRIGQEIYPKAPLGWNDARWCIVTEYNVPNNSLPVLFAPGTQGTPWVPLFERREPIG